MAETDTKAADASGGKLKKKCPICGKPARIKFCGVGCERKANAEKWAKERAAKVNEKHRAREVAKLRRAACRKIARAKGLTVQDILDEHGLKRAFYNTIILRGPTAGSPGHENAEKLRAAGLYDAIVNTGKKS